MSDGWQDLIKLAVKDAPLVFGPGAAILTPMGQKSFSPKTVGIIASGVALAAVLFSSFTAVCLLVLFSTTGPSPTPTARPAMEVWDPKFAERPQLPDDMRDVAMAAADHFRKHEYEKAAVCYQKILGKYPNSLYAWSNLGVVRFQQQDYDDARMALEKAIAFSPNDAFSYSNLGLTYYGLGQYGSAILELEKAVQLDPNDAKSWDFLGCSYAQQGDQQRAEEDFKKAIDLDRHLGDAYFNLALVYANANPPDLAQARTYYRQAIGLSVARDPRLDQLLAHGPKAN
jgi:tetratricopeptide (TPR) repeat protein